MVPGPFPSKGQRSVHGVRPQDRPPGFQLDINPRGMTSGTGHPSRLARMPVARETTPGRQEVAGGGAVLGWTLRVLRAEEAAVLCTRCLFGVSSFFGRASPRTTHVSVGTSGALTINQPTAH